MPDRTSLVSTFWLISTLTLLALASTAPIRTSGFVVGPSRSDCPDRDCNLSAYQPTTCIAAVQPADSGPQVNALPSETEEQDWADDLAQPRFCLPLPCSFRKVIVGRLAPPSLVLALYPLRC